MRHPIDDLTASLDGALAPAERASLEAHLAGCAACRAERDRLAGALALLSRLPPPPEPTATFEQRFQARLAADRARRSPRHGVLALLGGARWLALGLAGAAALLVVTGRELEVRRQGAVAAHLELLQDLEAVASVDAVESADDAEVVAHLHELRVSP